MAFIFRFYFLVKLLFVTFIMTTMIVCTNVL